MTCSNCSLKETKVCDTCGKQLICIEDDLDNFWRHLTREDFNNCCFKGMEN